MSGECFYVIVYDISNNKRRTRLHKRLKDYGTPVQYSVFECLLTHRQYDQMRKDVNQIVRPHLDHIRYYAICGSCRKRIEVTGRREVTGVPEVIIV